jgi:hypothetical protein
MAGGDVPERATTITDDARAGTERWQPIGTAAERAREADDEEVRRLAGLILTDLEPPREAREGTAARPEPVRSRWKIKRWRRAARREVYAPFPSDPKPEPKAPALPVEAPTAPPTEPPSTPSQPIVRAGAYCAPVGATGVTTAGTPMVCGPESDGRNRWHAT